MSRCRQSVVAIALGCFASCDLAAINDEWMDRLQHRLSWNTQDGGIRTRISGAFDLEGYVFEQPPPGLIFSEADELLVPRLTVYFDAQVGSKFYAFLQARADRGFDPSDGGGEARMDEYAVRITPWTDGRFSLQLGQFSTVVGSWVKRHSSWDNPFVTAPLAYENLTAVWDSEAPGSADELLRWGHILPNPFNTEYGDKHLRLPIVWGPSYATGLAVSGKIGKFEYAAEIKNGALSSRPEYWSASDVGWKEPTISARLSYRPNVMWDVGVSASRGTYLIPSATKTILEGWTRGDYLQEVLAQDVSFAWRHLQVWAEVFQCRFTDPRIGDANVRAFFVEAKYKFTPRLSGALRWNQQWFGTINHPTLGSVRWGRNLMRLDVGPTYRLTAYRQFKLQLSVQFEERRSDPWTEFVAAQFTSRF